MCGQACLSLALSPTLAPAAASVDDDKTLPWLVAGYSDGTVRLFDLNRVEMMLKMHPHASATTAVCFSTDG